MNGRSLSVCAAVMALVLASCATGGRNDKQSRKYRLLQDDSFDQIDPVEVCPLHHVETMWCEVPVIDGMCVTPDPLYARALTGRFPYSFWDVSSCVCESFGARTVVRAVCPACRALERRWRLERRYDVSDEVPCPHPSPRS